LLETSDSLHTHEAAEVDHGFAALIGLQNMPLMIWLAALLFSFGTAGFMVQKLTGGLPIWLAVAMAAMAALAFTRTFARGFARLVPKFETTATSVQFMGGLRGVVTQGTARVGAAAEVKLRDRHGNLHFVRCEPFSVEDQIVEGTEVLTLRKRLGPDRWSLTILSVS
jgi:membrane protein implicated in regulation of membrane protease activity